MIFSKLSWSRTWLVVALLLWNPLDRLSSVGATIQWADDDDTRQEAAESNFWQSVPEECANMTETTMQSSSLPLSALQHRYNSLTCWFYFLRVDIPEQSFSSHMVSVKIKDLVCTNFTLQVIDSHFTQEPTVALALGLANLSATCTGSYHSTGLSGNIEAILASGSPTSNTTLSQDTRTLQEKEDGADPTLRDPIRLLWTLDGNTLNPLEIWQPGYAKTASCVSDLRIPKLRFTGSASAHMIDWFRHSIQHYVESEVSKAFCPALSVVLDPLLNEYLHDMTDFLNKHLKWPYMEAVENVKEPALEIESRRRLPTNTQTQNNKVATTVERPDNAVRWFTEAPLLTSTSRILNTFINAHLHEGFLPRWFPSLEDRPIKTCGFFFHGINGIIHSLLDLQDSSDDPDSLSSCREEQNCNDVVNNQVWYSLPLPPRLHNVSFEWPGYGAISLDLYEIAIAGLDQWDALHVFEPISDDTFFTRLQTNKQISIKIQAEMNITQGDSNDGYDDFIGSDSHDLHEDFTFTFELDQWDLNSTLALWVNRDLWGTNVTAGVLLDVLQGLWPGEQGVPKDALHCLLESILGFEAPVLSLNTSLNTMKVVPTVPAKYRAMANLMSESLEQDLDDLLNNALHLLLKEYPVYISSAMAGLVDGPLRIMMGEFLQRITRHSNPSHNTSNCPTPNEVVEPHLLNFSQVLPLQSLQEFMKHTKTIRRMNTYIQCIADYIANVMTNVNWNMLSILSIEAESLEEVVSDANYENETAFRLSVPEFSFHNIGHIISFELLKPENDGLSLSNTVVYANESGLDGKVPHMLLRVALDAPNISAATNISIAWADVVLSGSSLIHYDVNQLKSFGLATVFQHGHCLLAPVDDFSASTPLLDRNTSLPLSFFEIVVNTSIVLNQDEDGERNHTYALSTEDFPFVSELANVILEWALRSSRDIVNLASIYSLSQASELCTKFNSAHHQTKDEEEGEDYDAQSTWSMMLVLASIFVMAQPALLLFRTPENDGGISNEEDNRPPTSEDTSGHLNQPLLDDRGGDEMESKEPALVDCPHVPLVVRTFLPTLIFVTIAILLSSNLSLGASVELTASVGKKTLHLPSLFEFTLVNTAQEMWQAGIYPVFFLVVVFSGIWPYAKMCIMLFCFISKRLKDSPRGRLLLALDSLGKFSLVDTYVLVLMMVAFRYHLQFFDSEQMVLDVMVIPRYGFYGFLLATTLSLVGGHVAVYYHRLAEMKLFRRSHGESACPPQSLLLDHSYQVLDSRRKLSSFAQGIIFVLLLSAVCLLAVGMTRPSFVFEFKGLAGIALGDTSRKAYSLISLGTSIPGSSVASTGTVSLMAAYFFYAVVAPFACLYFLFMLMVVPMTVQKQFLVLTLAEIANAWSAVEVFCLSIVAALLEISTFASFIIGDRCDVINNVIEKYWPEDHDSANANCFSVSSFVKWDAGILIAGALLNSFVVSITLRLAHAAMQERMQREGWLSQRDESTASLQSQHVDRWSFFGRTIGIDNIICLLFASPDTEQSQQILLHREDEQDEIEEEAIREDFHDESIVRESSWTDQHQESQSVIEENSEPLIEGPGSTERGN